MGCVALVLDSSRKVLPRLKIEVRCSCRGLYRRGRTSENVESQVEIKVQLPVLIDFNLSD